MAGRAGDSARGAISGIGIGGIGTGGGEEDRFPPPNSGKLNSRDDTACDTSTGGGIGNSMFVAKLQTSGPLVHEAELVLPVLAVHLGDELALSLLILRELFFFFFTFANLFALRKQLHFAFDQPVSECCVMFRTIRKLAKC